MSEILHNDFTFYQNANADAEKIKADFLIRKHEYEIIIADLRRNPMHGSIQHYLLVGRRGSGKSTLLKRLQVEIDTDKKLSQTHIAINLAEEQANIYKLFDLLEEIIDELDQRGVAVEKPQWEDDVHLFSRKLFAAIHSSLEKAQKKIVLLLDNIDRVFDNLQEDASLLREYLLNYSDIKIIGGSTKMTEHFWKYNKPFYEFFRVLQLNPLSSEEIKTLLLNWSKKLGLPQLKDFVKTKPGQLETIRILTDGLPRTLQFFVTILLTRSQESGYDYLKLIMDKVTPLYQERLNTLPPSQRKIVLQMAFLWEAAGAKELAEATHMDNKLISAQLTQLIEKGIGEKVGTKTKNNLYRLSERFFNLWLIFTQGNPREKRKAKCLTIFLENFYDQAELNRVALEHLKAMEDKKINPDKAALLTKAIAQSRYISSNTRDVLIQKTLQLTDISEDLRKQLPPTTLEIMDIVDDLVEKKQWTTALKNAQLIEQEDGIKEYISGFIYSKNNDIVNAESNYLKAIKKRNTLAYYPLAYIYDTLKKIDLAEKYYLLSIKTGYRKALNNLGLVYQKQANWELAEKYYLLAIKEGDEKAMNNLAFVYELKRDFKLAEKYYFMAADKGNNKALTNLGNMYADEGNFELAEKYCLMAIRKEENDAFPILASVYKEQEKFDLAEKYFKEGVQKKAYLADLALADFYYTQNKNKEEAYALVLQSITEKPAPIACSLMIRINAWIGKFNTIEKDMIQLIRDENDYVWSTIMQLLVHHQTKLVVNLFENPEIGQELKEQYILLYFLSNILNDSNSNISLKIPPELQATVNQMSNIIKTEQNFYYPAG